MEVTESLLIEDLGDAAGRQPRRAEEARDDDLHGPFRHRLLQPLLPAGNSPFDKIKIDRSLVAAAGKEGEARETVKGIVALAQAFGIPVACEGVETAEQAEFLGTAGSKVLQGDFLAKSLPFAEAMAFAGTHPLAAAPNRRSAEAVG